MGAVFALLSGYYFWIEKITGKAYNELIGQIHFWSMMVGVNLTFFPMHFLGLTGMPRRIPDYPDAYYQWNLVSSLGSIISMISTIIFLYGTYDMIANKESKNKISTNNWSNPKYFYANNLSTNNGLTLEFVLTSPPLFHTFNHLPVLTKNSEKG